jgi:apolipoprotein N-acyltransferase
MTRALAGEAVARTDRPAQMSVMPLLLRVIAATAAASIVFTIWLMMVVLSAGGHRQLFAAGALGALTAIGWAVTVTLGPVAAVQLWRLKESGRLAATAVFGFGLVYYSAGYFWLRSGSASSRQILAAIIAYAIPVVILWLPAARRHCR